MKNREKFKELIMSGMCDCPFVREPILKADCCNEVAIDCNACTMIQTLWLDEEAGDI